VFRELVDGLSLGDASIQRSHRLATACKADGGAREAVLQFATLGADGRHPQNIERDLHVWLRNLHNLELEPYYIPFQLFHPVKLEIQTVQVPVIAPHEWFRALWRKGLATFRQILLADNPPAIVLEWWERAMQQPWGSKHPAAEDPSLLDSMYPILFHYDGAEAYSNAEAHIWSMGSVFATGFVFDCKFINLLLMHERIPTKDLQDQAHATICKFYAWSLHIGQSGIAPSVGFNLEPLDKGWRGRMAGEKLAGGNRFCFGGHKTDRKATAQVHKFRRNHQAAFLCESCLAVRPFACAPPLFTFANFQLGATCAPWYYTRRTHQDYLQSEQPENLSPWVMVPGWHIGLNIEDLMHNALLGHAGDVICSTVKDLLDHQLLPGRSQEEQLQLLGLDFKIWCRAHGLKCPLGLFSASIFGLNSESGFPTLHTKVKAAHCRILLSFISDVAVTLCTGDLHSQLRTSCIWGLADFFYICDHSGRWFTDSEAAEVVAAGSLYLDCYQRLAFKFSQDGCFTYKVRPKHHYFACRILLNILASHVNPRYVHCFADEDFVGRIARLAKATCSKTVSLRVLQRWLLYLAQRWEIFEHGC